MDKSTILWALSSSSAIPVFSRTERK